MAIDNNKLVDVGNLRNALQETKGYVDEKSVTLDSSLSELSNNGVRNSTVAGALKTLGEAITDINTELDKKASINYIDAKITEAESADSVEYTLKFVNQNDKWYISRKVDGESEQLLQVPEELINNVKNIFPQTDLYKDSSYRGVAWKVNDDGSVYVNGTAAAGVVQLVFNTNFKFQPPAGKYIVSVGDVSIGASLWAKDANGTYVKTLAENITTGSEIDVDYDDYDYLQLIVWISEGASITEQTYYPMVRSASITDSTYTQHMLTKLEIANKLSDTQVVIPDSEMPRVTVRKKNGYVNVGIIIPADKFPETFSKTVEVVLFTLPVGYRPELDFQTTCMVRKTGIGWEPAHLSLHADGRVGITVTTDVSSSTHDFINGWVNFPVTDNQ